MYFTFKSKNRDAAANAILLNYKTSSKRSALQTIYPSAKISAYNHIKWIGIVREFRFEVVQRNLEVQLMEWMDLQHSAKN